MRTSPDFNATHLTYLKTMASCMRRLNTILSDRNNPSEAFHLSRIRENTETYQLFIYPEHPYDKNDFDTIEKQLREAIIDACYFAGVSGNNFITAITDILSAEDRLSHDEKMQILTDTLHQLGNSPHS